MKKKKKKKNALTLNLWITLPHFPLHIDTEWTLKYLQAEIGSSVCRHPLPTMKGWGQREWEGEGVQGEVGVQGSHYSSETTNWTTMRCKEWSHSNHVPRTGIALESSGCSQRLARDEGATVWGGEGVRPTMRGRAARTISSRSHRGPIHFIYCTFQLNTTWVCSVTCFNITHRQGVILC